MTEPSATTRPKVLVAAGSKHGATSEIAKRIARTLTDAGCAAVSVPPKEVAVIEGFDGLVLGSAVYAGRWTAETRDLVKRIGRSGDMPPVWLFSSGPVGDQPLPTDDPVDVSEIAAATSAVDHHIFAGKIDRSKLSFPEKAIMLAVRGAEGDFRDWDAIDGWARGIAEHLMATP